MKNKIVNVARMLEKLKHFAVEVTFGGGCDWSSVEKPTSGSRVEASRDETYSTLKPIRDA